MNSNFSKKIGTGVMVLLITLCFMPAIAGAYAPGEGRQARGFHGKGHHRSALSIWQDPQMVQNLNITTEQVKQLRDADFSFREKCLALKAQLDGFRLKMDKAFSDERVDETAVLKMAQKMSDVKGKLFIHKIEARLAVGKILNADQIEKLKLYDMHPKRNGQRQGRKRTSKHLSIERPDDKRFSAEFNE
jgi:Spy/CpxP family protein refolding chaperone